MVFVLSWAPTFAALFLQFFRPASCRVLVVSELSRVYDCYTELCTRLGAPLLYYKYYWYDGSCKLSLCRHNIIWVPLINRYQTTLENFTFWWVWAPCFDTIPIFKTFLLVCNLTHSCFCAAVTSVTSNGFLNLTINVVTKVCTFFANVHSVFLYSCFA